MQTTDVGNKESGKIWYRNPGPSPSNGAIVSIIRTTGGHRSKKVRFLHIAFDTTGEEFLAGDHHGNIYVFDVIRNRFRLIQKTAQACTALAFNLRRTSEYLVALADYSIKCFDKDTKQLVSWMRGHECAVSSVSVHSSGRYAITTSADTAQLWDLDTFQRKRKLNVRQSVGIQKVFFLPLSNTILSCFNDDSIFAWESDTLCCKYQLPVPQEGPRLYYRAFAVTRDGRTLAAGGRSNLLHLWSLDSRQLLRVVQMPPKVRTVRQLQFLPDNFDGGSSQALGVLSQDGIMRFINIQTCKLLFDIGTLDDAITSVAVSPSGHHIVTVMDSGGLSIFSVQALTQEFNKPPPSLVKVVTGVNMEDQRVKLRAGPVQRPAKTSGRRVKPKVLRSQALSPLDDKENELPDGLNKRRLQALLKTFGEYPSKYRMFVWRSLLRLPENHSAFNSLMDKGTHSAFLTLQERYPIKSQKLHRGLQRLLSALTYWSAIFGETDYLPLMAFPFVKLFQNNPLVCFEVVATVLVNWCQHWFEYFPNPPLNVLSMVENALAHHDKELLQHLINCGITSQLYVWPLLETLFSEVLTREEWLKLFDNVFSNHPAFLLMAVVSYVTCCRAPLLLCTQREDFEYFFHHRNHLDVTAVVKETYRLMDTTPQELHPRSMLSDFEPLTRGQYPVFNKYPTFIVEHQSQERERIRQQEMEYLRERQMVQDMQAETVRRQAADQAWYTQQELLQQAEEQRRTMLQEEESKLAEQRARLAAMKRELKLKELTLIDAARRRFLKHQHDQKRVELRRLDDEIQRKMTLRDQETAITMQDLELRQMELEAQRGLFEQQLAKEQERVTQEVNAEVEVRRRVADLEDSAFHQALDADSVHNLKSKQLLEESLAEAEQMDTDTDWKAHVFSRLGWVGAEQERHHQELSRLNKEVLDKEEQLILAMKEVEGKKWEDVLEKRARLAEGREACGGDGPSWEPEETRQHLDRLRSSQEEPPRGSRHEGHLKLDLRSPCSTRGLLQKPALAHSQSKNVCLNSESPPPSTSPSNSSHSAQLSLDRGRKELEDKERELMRDVRELRRRLADRSRNETSLTCSASIQPSITCGSLASEDTITNTVT
ncbi:TBC1 domain family member 31 [Conger conger]|uniref:TBC1 domain family member 31 n=1 Tax=Conger conger TaxID=82655 RepID=UPI002A59F35E|nr:TBC1 domain family member 31 [Conger conger]